MNWLASLASAFLMYSKIPMIPVAWKEENRRYALCFFPLIGVVIGGIFFLWNWICSACSIHFFLRGAISMAIPMVITGGIHLDGFCDVMDAKASCADRAKKLEIMADPHIGAFGVMWLCIYLLVQGGVFSQLTQLSAIWIVVLGFVLSRALSGFAAVTFRSAKKTGALQNFSKPAQKTGSSVILLLTALATAGGMIAIQPIIGGFSVLGAALIFVYYRWSSYRQFGGITGDLAGWFLQLCELAIPMGAVAGQILLEVM